MDPINLVKRAIPQDIPMKVTEILPRLKDGGAFVKVSHGPEVTVEDLEGLFYLSCHGRLSEGDRANMYA